MICCQWTNQTNTICLTVNKFEDDIPIVYYLDISLKRTSIDVQRKHTNNGQYVLSFSQESWPCKYAWFRALLHRFLVYVISLLVLQTTQQKNYQMQNRAEWCKEAKRQGGNWIYNWQQELTGKRPCANAATEWSTFQTCKICIEIAHKKLRGTKTTPELELNSLWHYPHLVLNHVEMKLQLKQEKQEQCNNNNKL